MHCNPILAIAAISDLKNVDWDATGVERFPFDNEQSRFIFIPSVSGEERNGADGTKVTKVVHDEVCAIFLEESAERSMSCFCRARMAFVPRKGKQLYGEPYVIETRPSIRLLEHYGSFGRLSK